MEPNGLPFRHSLERLDSPTQSKGEFVRGTTIFHLICRRVYLLVKVCGVCPLLMIN